ncbi:ribosome silencing factor [Pelagibacteraceae bacterium]|nr:ribosome silencing factor [Pelagibacteraceae bacterium]
MKLEVKEKNLEVKINKIDISNQIISILDDAKAENLKIIDLTNKSSIADSFIIATCRSTRHADSTADELIRRLKKVGIKCPNPEGRPKCDWIIVDAGSVLVHLFRQEIRDLYNLEKLWEFNFDSSETKLA